MLETDRHGRERVVDIVCADQRAAWRALAFPGTTTIEGEPSSAKRLDVFRADVGGICECRTEQLCL